MLGRERSCGRLSLWDAGMGLQHGRQEERRTGECREVRVRAGSMAR